MFPVLLVMDDSVLAHGLMQALRETTDLRLTDSCTDAAKATEAMERNPSSIVLLDANVPMSLSLVAELLTRWPEARICLWGRNLPEELGHQAMTMGVRGILRRNLPVDDVLKCLRTLAAGEVWFEERLMAAFFSHRAVRLTRRESQLITLLAQGMKNKEIAYALTLTEGTVKMYLYRLFEKLKVKDRFELALYGLRHLMPDEAGFQTGSSDAGPVQLSSLIMKRVHAA